MKDILLSLMEAYDDYVEILEQEIRGLVEMAWVHGWRSSRYEAGKKARARIARIKERVKKGGRP